MPLQIRRGTEAERLSLTSANGLLQGELLYNTSDKRVYIGTGVGGEHQGIPVTGYTTEDAQDAAAGLFTSGVHGNISFSYNDAGAAINATVDLTNYEGVISADSFNGTLVADDSSVLVDAIDSKINLDGTVKGNIIPNLNEAYDIGSASYKFKDLYLSGTSIYLGTANITASAGIVNLPAGSTIGGVEIGTAVSQDTAFIRDLQGSVFGDDSTLLVNSIDNSLFGSVINTAGLNFTNSVISTIGSPLEITPNPSSYVSIPFNINILAGSTTAPAYSIDTANFQAVDIRAFKGSVDSPVDIALGDTLGTLSLSGYSVTSGLEIGCLIGAQCDPNGNISGGAYIPTKFFVANQAGTGLGDPTPFLTFDSFGRLAVNQENAQATLDVNGFAKLAVLDTAPATPANGMIAIADGDSVGGWDPLGLGAPAKQQMVVYLGGGWRQLAVEP
jgi:hypothetical protein